jgi:peroxiredoxin
MKNSILTIMTVLLLTNISCKKTQTVKTQETKARLGGEAPVFTLANYDGNDISLPDYKGKIVVLEWFNYECPFSKYHHETANTMVNLADKYKDKNVAWLAINSTNHATAKNDMKFAEQFGIPYPVLSDFDGTVGHLYGAQTTPNMFIIDPNGILVYEGAIDNAPMGKADNGVINYVDIALGELTDGKKITTAQTKPYGCTVKYKNNE